MNTLFESLKKQKVTSNIRFLASASTMTSFAFAVYNGFMGAAYHSFWNGAICGYFLLLTLIRATLILAQNRRVSSEEADAHYIRRVYIGTHIVLIILNLSLIVPMALMIEGRRQYTFGLIVAILMAAYTVYRVTSSIIFYRKETQQNRMLMAELRTVNLIDSLVAVLTLQNAMVAAKGGITDGVMQLMAWTSGGIWLIIVGLTVHSFLAVRKK